MNSFFITCDRYSLIWILLCEALACVGPTHSSYAGDVPITPKVSTKTPSSVPTESQEQKDNNKEKNIPEEPWNTKFQATFLWQDKPSFNSPYAGANSLLPDSQGSYSLTSTAYLGARAWKGAELYFNPEMISAVPFSSLHGLGGLTNSEQQKTSGPRPTFYVAREFFRQTFLFGGGKNAVESGPNQLAGMLDKRRVVVTVGRLAIPDIFDTNAYAHDARTQFANWTFLTYGAFDYAADARGYTVGGAVEVYYDDWAVRAGRFEGPAQSNGLPLDSDITDHYGDEIEIEHSHAVFDQPGKVRVLGFRNNEVMGSFADAIAYAAANGGAPDLSNVRREQAKIGYGASLEQALGKGIGLFVRACWNDGKTETYSFTEIENSISTGIVATGMQWGREIDTLGLAVAQNGLGEPHREYLSQGGLGAFIGDGQLHYRPERIVETYYNLNVYKTSWLGVGFQRIDNPGYNADRGPVLVGMIRLHAEL